MTSNKQIILFTLAATLILVIQHTSAFNLADYPNASNTGVPFGTTLKTINASTIKKAGTIIQDSLIIGCLTIKANNVTVRRSKIIAQGRCGINICPDGECGFLKDILLEDIEVDGSQVSIDGLLVGSQGYTCRRCNIHHGRTGLGLQWNVTIVDSYIHDTERKDVNNTAVHITAASGHGGGNLNITHNTMICDAPSGCSSALSLYGNFENLTNIIVQNNVMSARASYCTYGGSLGGKPYKATNTSYIDNWFLQTYFPKCGSSGAVAGFEIARGNVWANNRYEDGTIVNIV
ncbi:hypothetical protein SAMD00019534_027320 [Acytostelium subglobosum LB1]|uniref:hypothetical protein n=1 Tax=Acytostelium subglobosum LB1 TaxID=1410327 RepID=UPI0006448D4B|nr:hypothetical protein SAMD00019534_027320 [Acytostelium subglobosum LB1]GAM19557.1 hypothetical protein SAMD00019534_027320 [Acytostelium subglobosum LB1]|eukprot:XP_012757484.1 hypothetical protein SAMD00019534_027320 [Acytostelium subglobosum LB1]